MRRDLGQTVVDNGSVLETVIGSAYQDSAVYRRLACDALTPFCGIKLK
jgi:hypothetical protein